MKKAKELLQKIEELRKEMNHTISKNDNLLDREIIDISKHLDEHLVEYYRLLKDRSEQEDNL